MMTVERAERELKIAEGMTHGLWAPHSRSAAVNARLIAEKCGMDSDKAYVLGLLHDIGRRDGSWGVEHIFDGYDYMTKLGEHQIARICLTHSYPEISNFDDYIVRLTCSDERKAFLKNYLDGIEYDDYDRLIQLCDAISLPTGACIMEKRLVDVALRHGVREFSVEKWKSFMLIKKRFDEMCGCNIYTLLPNVAENSFENLI